MNNHEFDDYIDSYRTTCDQYVGLSGDDSTFFAQYKARKLYDWLPQYHDKPCSILDFGCGDGLMTSYVHALFPQAQVTGADPSGKSIEAARELHPLITFQETEDHLLPFPDASFDIIYAASVFHHIEFKDHDAYLQELYRVLKPAGTFVLFELNSYNPLTVYTFKRNPIDQNATMVSAWYGYKLMHKYGTTETKFYCFFPKFLSALRRFEPYMTKIPFGALYAVLSTKR